MSPARVKTLVVQLGHCYRTTGATGTNGEQEFATAVGKACVAALDGKAGWRVRVVLADDHGADHLRGDAFVAIHADGSTNANARGASVGYQTRAGQAFGQAWKRCYQNRGWGGGFRADNYTTALAQYYGVREAVAAGTGAAIIIEAGFLTNPGDRAALTGKGGAERVAAAISDALGVRTSTPPSQPRQEDSSMRFVKGNGPRPFSDFVFKVTFPESPVTVGFPGGPSSVAVREYVDPADPGYQIAQATGMGMDARTGKPWVVNQGALDRLPFASQADLDGYIRVRDKHFADYQAAQK